MYGFSLVLQVQPVDRAMLERQVAWDEIVVVHHDVDPLRR